MSMPTHSKRILEHDYTVAVLPYGDFRRLQVAIWPVVLPILTQYIEQKDRKDTPWTLERVVKMVAMLLPLYAEAHRLTIEELAKVTRVEGQRGSLDKFAEVWWAESGYQGLQSWLEFALEVQLVPFLRGVSLDEIALLNQSTRSAALQSPTTSTGTFGGSFGGGSEP